MPVVEPFILNTFFKKKQYHASEKIDIEIRYGSDKLAQFVNQHEGALPIKKGKSKIKTVTTPRTFEKKIFSALELNNYNVAGNLYASTPAEQERIANEMVLQELNDLKDRVIRRREQMACEGLATGKIIIDQDNTAFELDYEYETNKHLITLTSTAKWNDAASDALGNLFNWKMLIARRTGINPDMIVLGTDATDAVLKNKALKETLHQSRLAIGELDIRGKFSSAGIWLGRILDMDLFSYTQQYSDGSQVKDMIPPKKVILTKSGYEGFRQHNGPMYRIEDGKSKIYQTDMLVETRTNEDKTALDWKVEQKCLPAIHEPDAVISATVL